MQPALANRAEAHPAGGPYRIFVVHHTHWDREWWTTYQALRIKLVELVDGLLDTLDADPSFRTFLLDSQTVVLRDYLEVRPEERERLLGHIRTGRLQCGPWYILPDEFLVGAEAHVRNLLLARRIGSELAIPLSRLGYLPDTFGHIGQMPQLLRGFGIDNAFIWRGYGGEEAKQEFRWQAPDGSTVQTHWFPDGYFWMPFLHFDNPERPYRDKLGRVFESIAHWGPRATAGVLLMPYGGDHRTFDRHLARKIELANQAIGELGELVWATPEEYVAAVRAAEPELETVRGELRAFGPTHPHVLPGVLSARLYLKQRNWECQTLLERHAEPLCALAAVHGARYDAGLLWRAWEYLIQNHPHDSICGCSVEPVHREMLTRFDQAEQVGRVLAERAADFLAQRIDTSALAEGERPLVVHNLLPQARSAWVSIQLDRASLDPRTHILTDEAGHEVPFTVRPGEGLRPRSDQWLFTEIGFPAEDVPAFGHRTYRLAERSKPLDARQARFTALVPVAEGKGTETVTDLAVGRDRLENAALRVVVERDGSLTLTDKASGQVYRGLNVFEDGGDAGDTYSYSAPLGDLVLRSDRAARVHLSVAEAGYARATLRVDLEWPLPAELSADRLSRSSEYLPTRLSTFVTLRAGARAVEIETRWENRTRDHRLRALFPSGTQPQRSAALGHFEVVERPTAVPDPGRGWPETYAPTMPHQGWVSVHQGERGLMIAARGLPEYEVGPEGVIALTLLRAVGWLSREDTLARRGGAGPESPTPDAQSLGPNRAQYALIPHRGSWLASSAYRTAEGYLTPLFGSETSVHPGSEPLTTSLLELEGNHTLQFSACKRAEEGEALVLRLWNVSGQSTRARLRCHRPVQSVERLELDERVGAPLPPNPDGTVGIEAGPHQILTLAIHWAGEP